MSRFQARESFLDGYEVHQVGGLTILEYWIPAEDPPDLNAKIIGTIEVIAEYTGSGGKHPPRLSA